METRGLRKEDRTCAFMSGGSRDPSADRPLCSLFEGAKNKGESRDCPYISAPSVGFLLLLPSLAWDRQGLAMQMPGFDSQKPAFRRQGGGRRGVFRDLFFLLTFSRKLVSLLQTFCSCQPKRPAHLCKDPFGSCHRAKLRHWGSLLGTEESLPLPR